MKGYSGFQKKKSNMGLTLLIVGVVHLAAAGGLYWLSQTQLGQELLRVYKLNMAQQKEEPPPEPESPPEPEPEPQPEAPPPPKPETPPPAAVEAPPPEPVSAANRPPPAMDTGNLFAIGKSRGKYAGYADIVTSMIQQQYQEPPDLPKGLPYAVLCQLVLDDQGHVLAYKLLTSSGNPLFDESAVKALSKVTQLRPPPEGMDKTLVVKFYPPT